MKYVYWLLGLVGLFLIGNWAFQAMPQPEVEPVTRQVFVYYTMPTATDMDFVAVEREVLDKEPIEEIALLALQELVKGPTEAERAQGLTASFNPGTEVRSVAVTAPGFVTIDFNEVFDTPMGGSARVRAITETIKKTFQQFDQTTEYTFKFTVEGSRDAVLEP